MCNCDVSYYCPTGHSDLRLQERFLRRHWHSRRDADLWEGGASPVRQVRGGDDHYQPRQAVPLPVFDDTAASHREPATGRSL